MYVCVSKRGKGGRCVEEGIEGDEEGASYQRKERKGLRKKQECL